MTEIGSNHARVHFPEILRRAEKGEKFVLTVRGKPVARLVPLEEKSDAEKVREFLEWSREFRQEVAKRGPILKPGETWKDLAREGLM